MFALPRASQYLFGILGIGALTCLAGAASAEQALRISYETSETHIKARSMQVFAERLKEIAPEAFDVQIFPSSSLIASNQEVTAAIRGQIEAIVPFSSYFEAITPKARILSTPLLFSGYDEMTAAFNGPAGEEIKDALRERNLESLAIWYEPPTLVFLAEIEAKSFDDLAGLSIRTYPSAMLENMIGAIGGNAAIIPGNEVYLALQNGAVDAALSSYTFAESLRLTEQLNYMIDQPIILGSYIFALNKTFYDRLSDEEKAAVQEAAAAASAFNYAELAVELDRTMSGNPDLPVKLIPVADEDRAKWEAAASQVRATLDDDLKALAALAVEGAQ